MFLCESVGFCRKCIQMVVLSYAGVDKRLWQKVWNDKRFNKVVGSFWRLWRVVGGCGRLWEVVEGYGRLWKVARGCGRLREELCYYGKLPMVVGS